MENPFAGGAIVDLSSELLFPLDAAFAQVSFDWRPFPNRNRHWRIQSSASVNITDPEGLMTDKDWLDHTLVSSTESSSSLNWIQASIQISRDLFVAGGFNTEVFAGVTWSKMDHEIVGYEGWYDYGGNGYQIPVSGTEKVLDYQLINLYPHLGGRVHYNFAGNLEFLLSGSSGFAILSDEDDHVQRGRLSVGEAVGLGVHGKVGMFVSPVYTESTRLRFGIVSTFDYHHAEGEQKQRWYQDEGSIVAGTKVSGIPLTFDRFDFSLGLELGYLW